jgi:hypothetical protein
MKMKTAQNNFSIQIEWLNAKKMQHNPSMQHFFWKNEKKGLRNEKSFTGPNECGPHAILMVHQMVAENPISPRYRGRPK